MFKNWLKILLLNGLACIAYAEQDSYYCPQKSGFIRLGMTPDQVIAACGMPLSQEESSKPATQKVPVQQVFFNSQGQSTAFYGVWALPGGSSNYGEFQPFQANNGGGGVQLEVDIADNVVKAVKINGNETKAFSVCGGININVGDPAGNVYNACGNPSLTNNTYIDQVIPSKNKPKIWIYQASEYENPVRLTFVNGRLLSIQ